MSRLIVKNLVCRHVGPISLNVAPGQCVALSGASGSGKTLLLRSISDLEPHTGDIWCDDAQCAQTHPAQWRRRVGMLASESHWWYDDVGAHFHNSENPWFEQLGFDPQVRSWQISRLSSGERQRLALARLLQNQPEVLLLDEPTANLDEKNILRVEEILLKYQKNSQAALVWVSHDALQIRRVAAEHYRFEEGRLVKV